ncbi:hypothetical protein [uncultured Ruminococcus sp.]|nr:hypothetical protein [uncultured Ruminococcus sp.]
MYRHYAEKVHAAEKDGGILSVLCAVRRRGAVGMTSFLKTGAKQKNE